MKRLILIAFGAIYLCWLILSAIKILKQDVITSCSNFKDLKKAMKSGDKEAIVSILIWWAVGFILTLIVVGIPILLFVTLKH